MMKIKEVVSHVDGSIITDTPIEEVEVLNGFAGDLLSVVMGKAQEGAAWVTIQSHINIVAVGLLVGVACIIVAEGYDIDPDAIAKANEEGLILISSPHSTYECSKALALAGL